MKKLMYIAAALLVLVGCQKKENVIENTPQDLVTITGGIDFSAQDGPNKVVAKEGWENVASGNQVEFMWEEGDKIAIVNGDMTEVKQFTVTSISEDKQTAEFAGEPLSGGMESYYVIYPYELGVAAMQQGGRDAFFANQQYTGKLRPAVQGVGTNDSFTLDGFFSVIDLSLTGSVKLGKIVYHVDNDGHGNPYDATLSFGDGGFQLADQPQHVTFTPCYFDAQGFTLSFYDTDNQLIMEKKSEKSIASVGGIISFATLEVKAATHEAVDLGLSSGLKWATCNVGATTPEGYGDYFAWGETSPKEVYDYSTYFDTNDGGSTFTKYNLTGGKTTLDPEDDAAHVNWGGNWRMPTKAEFDELRNTDNCTWEKKTNYNGTGVNGYLVTSKKNGNSIFLPASGYYNGSSLSSDGSGGYYWSSSLSGNNSHYAYGLLCKTFVDWLSNFRYYGQSVRPVCPKEE